MPPRLETPKIKKYIITFFIFVLFSLAYKEKEENKQHYVILKPLPIFVLLYMVYKIENAPYFKRSLVRNEERFKCIKIGLTYSALGDIFLIWTSIWSISFELGMLAFIVTHFFYIKYFNSFFNYKLSWILTYCSVIAVVWIRTFRSFEELDLLDIFAIVYSCFVTGTLVESVNQFNSSKGKFLWRLSGALGGILFWLSDFCIAVTLYWTKSSDSSASMLIMPLYYLSQLCITLNILK